MISFVCLVFLFQLYRIEFLDDHCLDTALLDDQVEVHELLPPPLTPSTCDVVKRWILLQNCLHGLYEALGGLISISSSVDFFPITVIVHPYLYNICKWVRGYACLHRCIREHSFTNYSDYSVPSDSDVSWHQVSDIHWNIQIYGYWLWSIIVTPIFSSVAHIVVRPSTEGTFRELLGANRHNYFYYCDFPQHRHL